MQGYGRKPVEPLARPGAGTWAALALFSLVSWWGLWGAAVEHTDVPNGFDWLCSMAFVGIAVSRWLARYGVERFTTSTSRSEWWFNSGRAIEVGAALLIPGAACWLAFRVILAHTRAGTRRFHLSVLWALWAVSGTTGPALLEHPVALFAACLLNAAAIATLMCLEPKPRHQSTTRIAGHRPSRQTKSDHIVRRGQAAEATAG